MLSEVVTVVERQVNNCWLYHGENRLHFDDDSDVDNIDWY